MKVVLCDICGDPCVSEGGHSPGMFQGKMLCWECLEELRDGKISCERAHLDSSGPGCPLEYNEDDASPGQDIAIREMENGYD